MILFVNLIIENIHNVASILENDIKYSQCGIKKIKIDKKCRWKLHEWCSHLFKNIHIKIIPYREYIIAKIKYEKLLMEKN